MNITTDGYFKWAIVVRLYHGVELMTAAFVFEHQAIEYARTLPEASKPFLRWIGHGLPPEEKHVTDGEHYL